MVKEFEYIEEDWLDIDDIYSDKLVEQLKDNDELSEEEDGFMQGYNRG